MSTITFNQLQAGFYNAFAAGLGFSTTDPFQIVQPAAPLTDDADLAQYFDSIPIASLTGNYDGPGANQFLSDYAGLMSALVPSNSVDFEGDIGATTYKQWLAYLQGLSPIPAAQSQPSLFRSWAMINNPSVAAIGSSDLSQMLLDPISNAQMAVLPYQNSDGSYKSATFTPDFASMTRALDESPSRNFDVSGGEWNYNVDSTWTKGADDGLFGLWKGSSSSSSISSMFAASNVSVSASFANVLRFAAVPGSWYSSSAFGLAYHNQTGNPWSSSSSINWDNTFGSSGDLQYFLTTLVIVNQMIVKVTSDAQFSSAQQTEINNNKSAGMWPFYSKDSSSSVQTKVGFHKSGEMTITFTSNDGVPVVVGAEVVTAGELLGSEAQASRELLRRLG